MIVMIAKDELTYHSINMSKKTEQNIKKLAFYFKKQTSTNERSTKTKSR